MRFLILEQGDISGTIPASYGELERLLILDMDFNQLTGTLQETLFDLNSLQQLDLNDNDITGTISPRYHKVVIRTNLDGNQADGFFEDGMIYYPWPWMVNNVGRDIGPWSCHTGGY